MVLFKERPQKTESKFQYHFSVLKIPNIGKEGRWDFFEKAANASTHPIISKR